MLLLPLAFFIAIALTVWLVCVSEAPVPVRVAVATLFVFSLWLRHTRFGMAGLVLQAVMGIFILLYQQTRGR